MKIYIDITNADPEQIPCFYGSECRISDVREWLDELPREINLEKVVRCGDCIFAKKRAHDKCVCLKTNTMHDNTYYCADGKLGEITM